VNGLLDRIFCPASAGVIFKDFGEETVVANLDTGIFYSLGGSAPALWEMLVAGHTVQRIAVAFGNIDVAPIDEFVASLTTERLLASATGAPSQGELTAQGPFVTPSIERFDDLQGLLLIDPIHDVSEAGWPLRPETAAEGS
jgi:hypothetical protein